MYTVAYMDLDTPNITVDTLSHRRQRFLVNYILFYYYYDSSGLRVELFSSIWAPQAIFFPLCPRGNFQSNSITQGRVSAPQANFFLGLTVPS